MGQSLISNPPYNMPWSVPPLVGFMPQYMGHSIPPKNNANYAFILTALHLISDRAVFLLPNGCMTSAEEKEIRAQLVEENLITAIISLPGSMFESTNIPVCILILDANKTTTKIELVDMRSSFQTEIRDQNGQVGGNSHTGRTYHKKISVLTENEMQKAIEAINTFSNIKGFCVSVIPDTVRKNDYNLSPGMYIEQENIEIQHRPFEEIVKDYNRIIRNKNLIQIRMNKTASKRFGYDCLDVDKPDLTQSFSVVGQTAEKEKYIRFSADDGIEIKCSTKEGIPQLILMFLNHWKQWIMYLNNEENRYLAEFRDALLPELMNGKIDIAGNDGGSQ